MSYEDARIDDFLEDVASERVAPAGGTAVAITGAMGAALCEMVCLHTMAARGTGREGTAETGEPDADGQRPRDELAGDSELTLADLRGDLERQRTRLLALADQDGALVDELFGAGAGEPSTRLERRAAGIPLAISEAALAVLEDAELVIERGRPGVVADAETGAYLADAAVRASLATVRINVATLSDASFAADIDDRVATVERSAASARQRVFGNNTG